MAGRVIISTAVLAAVLVLVGCETQERPEYLDYPFAEVNEIWNTPDDYILKFWHVEGFVDFIEPSDDGTINYGLKGKYGKILTVNTATQPDPGSRLIVWGSVQKHPAAMMPMMVEKGRVPYEEVHPPQASWIDGVPPWAPWVLGVLVLILIATIIWRSAQTQVPPPRIAVAATSSPTAVGGQGAGAVSDDSQTWRGKTVKMVLPPSGKTLKYIPGKLEVMNGPDKGNSFSIPGFPTELGSRFTIGRSAVPGELKFSHMEIAEELRTVSQHQAELFYMASKLYLKNKADTNPTHVNGQIVPVDEMVELQAGDTITMGELELKYTR